MAENRDTSVLDELNREDCNPDVCSLYTAHSNTYDIRAAISKIEDRAAFLHTISTIAAVHDTHVICFNADILAGMRHVHAAVHHAVRSFNDETMISNTLEMEALLYAAGSRQCSLAAHFGVHPGENHLYVCCYPACDGIWEALEPVIHIIEDLWNCVDLQKRAYLVDLFDITQDELATISGDRIADLVLEQIALLEVYR